MTDDQQSQAMATFNEALARGFETADFTALKDLYLDDAVVLPPRNRPMKGAAAIVAFWTGVRNRFSAMVFSTDEFKLLGENVARETGTFAMEAGEGGGTSSVGKYMVVWQKTGESWKVDSCIWSRNAEQPQRQAGQAGGQGGGRRQGGGQGAQGGGMRQGGGQGGGQMGYRQGSSGQGGGQGSYRQAGYRGTGLGGGGPRGGIGGGAGISGAGRRANPQQGGRRGQGGGGQGGRGQDLYGDSQGLYSNQDD